MKVTGVVMMPLDESVYVIELCEDDCMNMSVRIGEKIVFFFYSNTIYLNLKT